MNMNLNGQLVDAIRVAVPHGTNIANLLMDMLCISKDAVYRRIRGDVSFTLEELSVLSEKLNISLDNVLGLANKERGIFNLNLFHQPESVNDHITLLKNRISFCKDIAIDPAAKAIIACDILPPTFCFKYDKLRRFYLYRWLFQNQIIDSLTPMSDLGSYPEFDEVAKNLTAQFTKIPTLELIIDNKIFTSFVQEVLYFIKLELISKEEINDIRKELDELISSTEISIAKGRDVKSEGQEIVVYLSDINIENSNYYYENSIFSAAEYVLYSNNTIHTKNPEVCQVQKEWMKILKRFSTIITHSGEIYRRSFFNNQKRLVKEMFDSYS
ncbi:MAG: hypothetical protein LUG18_12555 [Candidatus Azobacteroides sp.]|nr:hypothetical protein [Candidatus Azobacteroides sp.]